ncbi:MAG: SPL family radical SAM protein [Candidatus Margulisiibacteriota bacterium]
MQNFSPKPIKYVDKVKRPLVRPCPCAVNHVNCGYVVISHILNCPFNCSYCYLHTFFGRDEIVIFDDEQKIISEVKDYLGRAEHPLRVGTGEFSDSLALPEAKSLAVKLVELFAHQNRHFLELKTKSAEVDFLLDLNPRGQTVVAWSVNPQKIIDEEEHGSASLKERIVSAVKCLTVGYRVAFHFDPIIYFDNWQESYEEVINYLFDFVPSQAIAWISLGTLRFPFAQKEIMQRKFNTKINLELLEKGLDRKLRYPVSLRLELLGFVYEKIKARTNQVYIYLCMETEEVWNRLKIEPKLFMPS